MADVEPCPFCGSTDLDVPQDNYTNHRQVDYYLVVRCKSCTAHGPYARVVQLRADGQPYSRDSRRPLSPEGRERWQNAITQGAQLARKLWNRRGSHQIEVLMDHPDGPAVLCPVDDPGAVEAALPPGWTIGDSWWASLPTDRQPDGRWLLKLSELGARPITVEFSEEVKRA